MRYLSQFLPSFTLSIFVFAAVLLSSAHAQFEPVSISPNYPHSCVNTCVYHPPGGINFGLECEEPVANRCYCPTTSAAATRIDSFVSRCATEGCGAGDVADDMVAIKSIYASYCVGAGFTAPFISKWYTPARTTSESESTARTTGQDPPTTTQLTIATQTSPISNSGSRFTQVTVQATSTQWIDSQGTGASIRIGDPDLGKKLGIGLGVGVPILLIVVIAIGICLRKRHRSRAQAQAQAQVLSLPPTAQDMRFTTLPAELDKSPTIVASETLSPVSPTSELAGGREVRGELDGKEIVVVPGEHELYGHDREPYKI